jgi:hypothetical protein
MSIELACGIVLDDEAEDREEDDPLESEGVRPEELEDAGLGLLVDGGMRRCVGTVLGLAVKMSWKSSL